MLTYKEFLLEEEDKTYYSDGVYMGLKMTEESVIVIEKYCKKYLTGLKINTDWHTTLIYSQKEQKEEITPKIYSITSTGKGFSKFGKEGEILVLELNSDLLEQRNRDLVREFGFVSNFDEYKPHTTLVYDAQNIDINSLPEIDFAIHFENEYVEPLDTDWANNSDDEDPENRTLVGKALQQMKKDEEKPDEDDKEEKDKN